MSSEKEDTKKKILDILQPLPNPKKAEVLRDAVSELDERALIQERDKLENRISSIRRQVRDKKASLAELLEEVAADVGQPVKFMPRMVDMYMKAVLSDPFKGMEENAARGLVDGITLSICIYEKKHPVLERDIRDLEEQILRNARVEGLIPKKEADEINLRFAKIIRLIADPMESDYDVLLGLRVFITCMTMIFPESLVFKYLGQEKEGIDDQIVFMNRWAACGYPNVRLEPKLASAMALTDIPDDIVDSETKLPWPAFQIRFVESPFSVQDPKTDEFLPIDRVVIQERQRDGDSRWMMSLYNQAATLFTVTSNTLSGLSTIERQPLKFNGVDMKYSDRLKKVFEMCMNTVVAVCLRMTNREDVRRLTHAASRKGRKLRFSKLPETSEYVIGGEINIDCVQVVRDICLGQKPRTYKVQWLVRGFFRNQPYGKGRELRRRQWIEPFWKGDVIAPILVRSHTFDKDKKDKDKDKDKKD